MAEIFLKKSFKKLVILTSFVLLQASSLAAFSPENSTGNSFFLKVFTAIEGNTTANMAMLNCALPPLNDLCAAAAVDGLLISGIAQTGCTDLATATGAPTACTGGALPPTEEAGVWFTFVGTGNSTIISTAGTSFDVEINAYEASVACTALTCIAGGNATAADGCATLQFSTTLGTLYYIYLDGTNGEVGEYEIIMQDMAPLNDGCIDVGNLGQPLLCGIPLLDGSTLLSTDTDAPMGCDATPEGAGVWYGFIGLGSDATITISDNDCFNPEINIYTGTACSGLTCVASGTTSATVSNSILELVYYVYIDGIVNGETGTFSIQLDCTPPLNDMCATALPLVCAVEQTGSTAAATALDAPTGCTGGGSPGAGVWYQFVGTGLGTTVTTSSTATDFDTEINIYSATAACLGLNCIAGDDNNGAEPNTSEVMFTSALGTLYYVYVDGVGTETGTFGITLQCAAPVNDACSTALPLVCGVTLPGVSIGSTAGDAPLDCADSSAEGEGVWYLVVGTGTDVTVSTSNTITNFDTEINVYSGLCGSLVCLASDTDSGTMPETSEVTFGTTIGTTYYVYIDGETNGDTGTFAVTTTCIPPVNDMCLTALPLVCNVNQTANTGAATSLDAPTGCANGGTPEAGVWYTFVGTGFPVTVSTDFGGTDFDTEINVYSGLCTALTCVGGNDEGGTQVGTSELTFTTQLATTYYVYVDGASGATGNFEIGLNCVPPINDQCLGALPLVCGVPLTGTTAAATNTDAPTGCAGGGTPETGVWFTFPGTGTQVTVSTDFVLTDFDTEINVYSGLACAGLTCVAGDDNGGSGVTSSTSFLTTLGTFYYVYLDGVSDATGNYQIELTCLPPLNDQCLTAEPLLCNMSTGGNTGAATALDAPATCAGGGANENGVWFLYVGTGLATTISTNNAGTNFDTELSVYSGICGSLTCVTGDASDGINNAEVTFTAALASTYYIYLDGVAGATGDYELSVNCPLPTNDQCLTATPLVCGIPISGTTMASTALDAPNECPTNATQEEEGVWFTFPGTGTEVTVTTDFAGTDFDTEINVYEALIPCMNLQCVANNDNGTGATNAMASEVSFQTNLGSFYHIYLDGASGETGNYQIQINCSPPINDQCLTALPLVCNITQNGSTGAATAIDAPVGCAGGGTPEAGVWYTFVGTGLPITISTDFTGTNFDTELNLYSGLCGALNCVIGNDNGSETNATGSSEITFTSQIAQTYYVYVDGVGGTTGNFSIQANCTPPVNDLCAGALPLVCGVPLPGNTIAASDLDAPNECPADNPAMTEEAGLWYLVIGTGEDITVTTDFAATNFDTEINVYTSGLIPDCNALTCVANDDNSGVVNPGTSVVTFETVIGDFYYVYVDGATAADEGNFQVQIDCLPPVNDACITALPLVCNVPLTGNTSAATALDAPNQCPANNVAEEAGIWYFFIGTGTAITVTTDNPGTNFDTELNVYANGLLPGCGNLTCEANNDNKPGATVAGSSEVTINTLIGEYYYIYVDGSAGETGTVVISLDCLPPVNDQCLTATPLVCGVGLPGTTAGASNIDAPDDCNLNDGTPAGNGVWYTFLGTGSDATISTDFAGTTFDTRLHVYQTLVPCVGLTCVGYNDNGSETNAVGSSEVTVPTLVGFTYHIYVDGVNGETGNFNIEVQCLPPVNDLCMTALPAVCNVPSIGNTAAATALDAPMDCNDNSTEEEGVWYFFLGTGAPITVAFDGALTNFDAEFNVYNSGLIPDCSSLTCVGNGNTNNDLTLPTTNIGETYYIYVDGIAGETGNFSITVNCLPPVNDQCLGALPLLCEVPLQGNTAQATAIDAPDDCFLNDGTLTGVGLWYSYIGTGLSTMITTDFATTDFDTRIHVYSSTLPCMGLTCVAQDDNSGPDFGGTVGTSELTFTPDIGTIYYIYVEGAGGATGTFSISAECIPPINDQCITALPIVCNVPTIANTSSATALDAPMDCNDGTTEEEGVWYLFPGTGFPVTFEFDGVITDFDAEINVYSSGLLPDCTNLSCVANGDTNAPLTVPTNLLENYYIYVDGAAGETGSFSLTMNCLPPPNDQCLGALPLVCGLPLQGNTLAATDVDAPDNCPNDVTMTPEEEGLWYVVVGTGLDITISTDFADTDFDTEINLYSGTCLTLVCEDNDDNSGPNFGGSELTFTSVLGTLYYVYVDGANGEMGNFSIQATCLPPPNDLCLTALPLVCGVPLNGSTNGATALDAPNECPADDPATIEEEGVWFTIVGTGQTVTVSTDFAETDFDTELNIYSGTCLTLTCVANDDNSGGVNAPNTSVVTFPTAIGTLYYVHLDGANGEMGTYRIGTTCTPPLNGDCANAPIVTCDDMVEGSTLGGLPDPTLATASCDPLNPFLVEGAYYQLAAGTAGMITASVCDAADFDSRIAIFSGACGSLTCVAENDDAAGCTGNTSEVTFTADPNMTYYIFVTGSLVPLLDAGTFTLSITSSPTITCPADVVVDNDTGACEAVVNYDLPTGTGDCGVVVPTLTAEPASGSTFPVGTTMVTYTVTEMDGEMASCTFNVTVNDAEDPEAMCITTPLVVELDANGMASITPADIDGGSTDNCENATPPTLSVMPMNFTCADLGDNTVTLTVEDADGNMDTCTATVTVEDNIDPMAMCTTTPITVVLDANGMASITPADVDNGSSDNCPAGDLTLTLDQMDFTCADVGDNTVTLTATDMDGNSTTCTATVTVEDNDSPTATCMDITVTIGANGMVTFPASDIDDGSTDNCPLTFTVDGLEDVTFDCTDIGDNTVTVVVTDSGGNTDMCTATVTVEEGDNVEAMCMDITVELDANGMVSITSADVDDGSTSTCNNPNLSLDMMDFDCTNLGANTVTLTATDADGNMDTCTATVTVEDNIDPMAMCTTTPITVVLDANGMASITPADVDNGSSDNCPAGDLTLTLDQMDFTCADVGNNTVTLTATDMDGNSTTCTATVIVEDDELPVAMCMDISVTIGGNGMVTFPASDVDDGSTDNCPLTFTVNNIEDVTFDCTQLGNNTVTVAVSDGGGNVDMCTVNINVSESNTIDAVCQNITVQLDANGMVSIIADDVDGGSTGSCDTNLSIDVMDFTCADIGNNNVVLTVSDNSGNSDMCTAVVTVTDTISPMAMCMDIEIDVDANGMAMIQPTDIDNGSTDNCDMSLDISLDITAFDCNNLGNNTVMLTATDDSGNMGTCTANVFVDPASAIMAICQDIEVELNQNSMATITADDVDDGSFSNCGGTLTLSIDQTTFGCSNIGENTVTLTASDSGGFSASCTATVTVVDFQGSLIVCRPPINTNTNPGECVRTDLILLPPFVSNQTCGGFTVSDNAPDEFPVGITTVTVTITFATGQIVTCERTVTINDTDGPSIVCSPTFLDYELSDGCSLNSSLLPTPTATDGCDNNVQITSDAPASLDIGTHIVTYTAVDDSGNMSTCSQTVTVSDGTPPTLTCPDDITTNTTVNSCGAFVGWGNPTVSDNCGTFNLENSHDPFTFFPIGETEVTYTGTDNVGNTASCSFTISVSPPNNEPITFISCPEDITVFTYSSGGSFVTWDPPVAEYNGCTFLPNGTFSSGDFFPIGTTEVVFTTPDDVCSFTVTVLDAFFLDCPEDFVVHIPPGQDSVQVEWNEPFAYTECPGNPDTTLMGEFRYLGHFNDTHYWYSLEDDVTWFEAEILAENAGGHLAIIESEEENIFLRNELLTFDTAWIGAREIVQANPGQNIYNDGDEFFWFDNDGIHDTLTYTNWAPGRPDTILHDTLDFFDYLAFQPDGQWIDMDIDDEHPFIMEIPDVQIEQIFPFGYNFQSDSLYNGSFFPVSQRLIFYKATDACGNEEICSFFLTVEEDIFSNLFYCEQHIEDTTNHRFIKNVELVNIQNESGDNQGYEFFENHPTDLIVDETVTMTIEADDEHDDADYLYWRVWIDHDHDSDFYDDDFYTMDENLIFEGEGFQDTTFQFVVPAGIVFGNYTRMRVALSTNDYPDPCGNIYNGEVEDYPIRFRYHEPPFDDMELNVFPNPSNGNFNVETADFVGQDAILRIHTPIGFIVHEEFLTDIDGSDYNVNVNLQPGMYFVSLQIGGDVFTQVLIIM